MHHVVSLVCFLILPLTLSLAAATPSYLQPQGGLVQPTPLAADDPRAERAAAVVKGILAGEREKVVEMLKAEGTPAFAESANLESLVDAQIARLGKKGYTIADFMTGRGADVIVELSGSGDDTNLVIRFTPEVPHRIEGFAVATMG